jgi:hypothetical protein
MRVIVDPNAKVPDDIVRKIPLPKPAARAPETRHKPRSAATSEARMEARPEATMRQTTIATTIPANRTPASRRPGKPTRHRQPPDAGKPHLGAAAQALRTFASRVARLASRFPKKRRQRSEDARRNKDPEPPGPPSHRQGSSAKPPR